MQEAVLPADLREKAEMCLRLAKSTTDPEAIAALRNMAMEYQIRARRLEEHSPKMDQPRPE